MKTVIITGASGGIGSAIARHFALNGYRLLLIYKSDKRSIDSIKKELKECEIHSYQCDLSNTTATKRVFSTILKSFEVDCLINCAGVSQFGLIQDTTDADYSFVFDNNVKSMINATKFVAKSMISAKRGSIINISSMWGNSGSSMESIYSASKGAVNTLTISLAKELGPSGIRVNAILPGFIDTKMNTDLDKDSVDELINATPLSRIGKPSDVANLALFLASEESSFITGQLITIDGGLTL